MDRFQEMQVFIRIAERSSFTRAADDLQIPEGTVTSRLHYALHALRLTLQEMGVTR